jgi:hypothetical protein
MTASLAMTSAQTPKPPPPPPKPFPQPGASPPPAAATTAAPSRAQTGPAPAGAPTEATLGVSVYPGAEYLQSYDAGHDQRYFIYGTNTPFPDIVNYYRTVLKNGGRELFKAPAMQQWDLGKYVEETMAYPPSVTVKDYTWNGSEGYLVVDGLTERRFKTIIQVVPATVR